MSFCDHEDYAPDFNIGRPLSCSEVERLCAEFRDQLATVKIYTGGPLVVAENGGAQENEVQDHIDRVCDDLSAGRVVPRQTDQLREAIDRAKTARGLHRAINQRP